MFRCAESGQSIRVTLDDLTQVRIAGNQVTFREANESIEAAVREIGIDGDVPFICECAEPRCTAIVRLSLEAYEEIRRNPRLFFNLSGHEATAVESGAGAVVEERGSYVLVEKTGIAGEIAERAES